MRILYISCHSILEYDEISLFHELGHDIFSAGAYSNPMGHPSLPRPPLTDLPHYPTLERAASTINVTGGQIPSELIEWAETIIFMHQPEILEKNWQRIKHKRVVFRSIGQCVSHQEDMLRKMREEGLQIVRYSPKEVNIPHYAGHDKLIRFYKDPEEYRGYTGIRQDAINISQSLKQRGDFCYYSEIVGAMKDSPSKVYGIGNENLGELSGGELSFDDLKGVLRDSGVYVYGGTIPAQYTLSFMEALMTGIPIVAVGRNITLSHFMHFDYYEIADIIKTGLNGFLGETPLQMREYVQLLLSDRVLALKIGEEGRKTAIELFGKEQIAEQWRTFLQ